MEGYITDIQHFSIHDGPGIRTTVFLKGCNLRCYWCHNPETISPELEIQFFPDRCIGCRECIKVCPNDAHKIDNGVRTFIREKCNGCGRCTKTCYSGCLIQVGKKTNAQTLMEDIMLDKSFYDSSGGGVTVSGGEPLFQYKFTQSILNLCRMNNIHTAIESNMAWNWERVEYLLPVTDLIMMDIKTMSSDLHRQATGVSNELILQNAKRLDKEGIPLIIRTPIIANFNDCKEEVSGIAKFLSQFKNLQYYELLPYHPLGVYKYKSLGKKYDTSAAGRPSKETMHNLLNVAQGYGICVKSSESD
jgi:pyruvate formate lyase activating enzyme